MKFTGSTGWCMTLARNHPARSSGSKAETEAKAECSTMKHRVENEIWGRPGWGEFRDINTTCGETWAFERVCQRRTSRPGRDTAGLSGWPFSEPCKAGADGHLLEYDPSACGTCSEDEPLSRTCPKQYRRHSCASEDWGVRVVLLRHRTVDKGGLPKRGPFFRVFQWQEPYGRFPRVKCSSVAVQYASRYPLERTSFLRAEREDGHP